MAKARRELPPVPRYERDYYSWALEQAALLRERRLAELDFDNLAEEVEDLGRSMADQLGSRYETLLMHLLKWEFQPDKRSNSWAGTIRRERSRIEKLLIKNPGLKSRRAELFNDAYDDARLRPCFTTARLKLAVSGRVRRA